MTDHPILKVENLSKSYGGIKAVDGVSFELAENEVLGVIGPNGSGKTTLVNLITGFARPNAGRITFRDKEITKLPPYKVADLGLARSFQMVKPFYDLSSFKNMIVPLFSKRVRRLVGGRYGDRDSVAKDLLEEVGFERDAAVITQQAASLPHGYLKRLELARCMALRADLMILDELFSGLSLAEVAGIVPIINKLVNQGKTIVMVEHRLKELFRLADRIIVLNFGRKIAEGTPKDVMNNPDVRSAYLGSETEE